MLIKNKKREDRKNENGIYQLTKLQTKTKITNKKAVALEFLFWLILGVVVLVIMVFVIIILTGKSQSAIEFIKDLFRLSFVIITLANSNPAFIKNN